MKQVSVLCLCLPELLRYLLDSAEEEVGVAFPEIELLRVPFPHPQIPQEQTNGLPFAI